MKRCAALLLSLPLSCFAVDGVYEINQLCVDSGCFNGDSAGWPVTLAQTGSYRLTSNLDTPNDGSTAVYISAGNVSLDLNGFTIGGVAGLGGGGIGIHSIAYNTSISDGFVFGMGGTGIVCGSNCWIDKVIATFNTMAGIEMTGQGLLTNSASSSNNVGVVTNGVVRNCVISGNASAGLTAFGRSQVEASQIIANTDNGVQCNGCSLVNNVIIDNGGTGIVFSGIASYGGNHLYGNAGGDINMNTFETAPNNCSGAACSVPPP